jgi:alpha-tubulin suppressor-like RCC1 family protein
MRSTCLLLAAASPWLVTACLDIEPAPGGSHGTASSEISLEARTHGQLVAGKAHACVIMRDGTVRCWGAGTDGQLGDGAGVDRFAPVAVTLSTRAIALAAGDHHTCAVLVGGQVACWGDGSAGQTGVLGDQLAPVLVPGLGGVTALSAGSLHTCALHGSGRVSCWGANTRGQLGDGTTTASVTPHTVIASGVALESAVALSAGGDRSCATRSDNAVHCWGDNLPNLNSDDAPDDHYLTAVWSGFFSSTTPTTGDTRCRLHPITFDSYSCTGMLAFPSTTTSSSIAQIDTSDRFLCFVDENGAVYCRGANDRGQLATGHANPTGDTVVVLSGGHLSTAVGDDFACALGASGAVSCWGRGDRGQIGDGVVATTDRLTARAIAGGLAAGTLDLDVGGAGGRTHACAIADGAVRCLGNGTSGQLGNGGYVSFMTPQTLSGFEFATAMTTGGSHSCAMSAFGVATCWGANASGQLGDTTYTTRPVPATVFNASDITDIAAGNAFTCATRSDGTVACWGSNSNGQLGLPPTSIPRVPSPRNVNGFWEDLTFLLSVEAGDSHVCALDNLGLLWCWGNNTYGQGGAVISQNVQAPRQVIGNVRDMALGAHHTCALLSDGTIRCVGRNAAGQLGDGTKIDRHGFVQPSIDRVVAITAGYDHTCALRDDGTAKCWGGNKYGQLGVGDTTTRTTPTSVFLDRTLLVSIAAGDTGTCGKRRDGMTACWGLIGQGTAGPRLLSSTPTVIAGF